MLISEGLRKYHERLYPGVPIDEVTLKQDERNYYFLFYQAPSAYKDTLNELMITAPADVLRMHNGTGEVEGHPTKAREMLERAIAGAQALEQIFVLVDLENSYSAEYFQKLIEGLDKGISGLLGN